VVLNFIIYLDLLFIKLFQFHNLGREFCGLAMLTCVLFFVIFNFFFPTSFFKIEFIGNKTSSLFFDLLFKGLSHAHDPGREFYRLNRSTRFFIWIFFFQFYLSTLSWLRIRLYFFYLLSLELSQSPNQGLIG